MNMENESRGVILAVDDNPENLGVLFDYLDQAGFTVLLVQDSENALTQAESNLPDLILLDIMMPGLDGFEVCRRLKANDMTKDIPVIFMTALSDTEDKVKGFDVGGVDYITKPIQHKEVEARVLVHLTIRKLQRELQRKNEALERYVDLLAKNNEQLQEANNSKDKFFSIISHDLRNPFTGLCGLTEVLAEHFDDYEREEIKNLVIKLRDSSEILYALLENLLTWSRSQCNTIEYNPQTFDLQGVIIRHIAVFTSNAEQKQITIRNAVQEQTSVYGDEKMIDIVVRNLLSNALKFTGPGGYVDISTVQDETHIITSVSDTGIGIAEEHIPKLFRIDAKFKLSGTANEKGTGLGLILCKEFVEKNGGNIWVESEVGKGTTFRFTIPKAPVE